VTLVLLMNAPNAICMSVDYRVTDINTGKEVNPFGIKSLVITASTEPGGPKVLLGYSGLAELWGRLQMGHWLRQTLRGASQPLPDLMDLLLRQLNRKIARFNEGVKVSYLTVNGPNGEERYYGTFTNENTMPFTKEKIMPQFVHSESRIDTPQIFRSGSGAAAAQAPVYVDMARAHLADPNHSAVEHMTLLADINRGVAEADSTVSPYCFVACVGSDTNWTPHMQVFHEPGETPPPFHAPWIVAGIDVSNPLEQLMQHFRNGTHPALDADQIRRNLDRRP